MTSSQNGVGNPSPEDAPETDGWDSPQTARRNLRSLLQGKHVRPEEIWHALVNYIIAGRFRGETRTATRLAFRLLEEWESRGIHLLAKVEGDAATSVCWSMGTSLPLGAEDPSIPLSRLHLVEQIYLRHGRETNPDTLDPHFVPLALHRRLGLPPDPAHLEALLPHWESIIDLKKGPDDPPSASEGKETPGKYFSSSFCSTAQAQIIIEALIAGGRIDEAITLAKTAVAARPCLASCQFAPKGFLSMLLEPLLDRGETDLAARWEEHIAAQVASPVAGLAELGYRAAYFAKRGDSTRARDLIELGSKTTLHPEISDWKKLEFHRGAVRALRTLGEATAEHEAKVGELERRFGGRNAGE